MLDIEALRSHFPSLGRPTSDGRLPVYMDGPAGTQVPRPVIDAVAEAMETAVSNLGGDFAASHRTEEVVAGARAAVADLLGAEPGEVAFGANMTTLTFAFSRAVAATWESGDNIVLSSLDHDANITPWARAAADRGVEVRLADIVPDDVTLDLDHVETLLDRRTRLVAVTACSNAFGTLVDVARVSRAAHEVGAICFVDAVHLAPHRRIEVTALGVDALVCSAYKFYGPHVGVLWMHQDLAERVEPYKVRPSPETPPGKFETGTAPFPLLAGVTATVDHIASLGQGGTRTERLDLAYQRIGAHERRLGERLLQRLPDGVRVWGPPSMEGRVSTFAWEVEGHPADKVAQILGEAGIYTWAGHYYAVEPMRRLGLLDHGGLLRVGLVKYTSDDEVDRLLSELDRL